MKMNLYLLEGLMYLFEENVSNELLEIYLVFIIDKLYKIKIKILNFIILNLVSKWFQFNDN